MFTKLWSFHVLWRLFLSCKTSRFSKLRLFITIWMGIPRMIILHKQFRRVHWYDITNKNIPYFIATYVLPICVLEFMCWEAKTGNLRISSLAPFGQQQEKNNKKQKTNKLMSRDMTKGSLVRWLRDVDSQWMLIHNRGWLWKCIKIWLYMDLSKMRIFQLFGLFLCWSIEPGESE